VPTKCNRLFLLQTLLRAQHVSGTIMPIIRSLRVLYSWLPPVVFGLCVFAVAARKPDTQPSAPHHTDNLKTKARNTTGSNHLYNTLELLMMGIMVPETCWASNKICNKKHLLHIVGILFPHIKVLCRTVYVACLWFIKSQRDISKFKEYIHLLVCVWGIVSMNLCWGVVYIYGNMKCCRYNVVGLPTASYHWHWPLLRALRFTNCMFTFTIFQQLKSVIICVLCTIIILDTDHCVRNIW
jgi:hypothetical protein